MWIFTGAHRRGKQVYRWMQAQWTIAPSALTEAQLREFGRALLSAEMKA
jgi:hypothetical protein